MAIAAEILTVLRADARQFKAEIASAQGTTQSFAGATGTLATVGKVAFIALAGAAVAASVIGVKAALEHEEAHARLVQAIKNSGSTWSAEADRVESLEGKMRNLGFADHDTENSLSRLVTATKNVGLSTHLMGLATDIARARGIDLSAATDVLVKVEGQRYVGLAKTLGVSKQVIDSFKTSGDAVKYLTDRFGGQGVAFADTFKGKLAQLEAQANHVAVAIGEFLIPKLAALAGAIADTIGFFENNTAAAIALALVIGGPLAAAMTYFVSLKVIEFVEGVINGMLHLIGVIPGVTSHTIALTTAHRAAAAAAAEQAAANEVAVGSIETTDAALVTQMSLLAEDGAALDFGSGQLALFSTAELEVAASSATADAALATTAVSLGVVAAAVALPIAVLVGLGYAFDAITDSDIMGGGSFDEFLDGMKRSTDAGKALGAQMIQTAQQTGNAEGYIKSKLADQKDALNRLAESYKAGNIGQEDAVVQGKRYQTTIDALQGSLKKLAEKHRELTQAAEADAKVIGVSIPNASSIASDQLKLLTKDLSQLANAMGVEALQGALNLASVIPTMGTALDNALKQTQAFSTSLASAMQAATDPFTHFKDATVVSGQDFINFLTFTSTAANTWAGDITKAINEGVNLGLIDELAKAGPGSQAALSGLLAAVDQFGVGAVNSLIASGQQAHDVTVAAYARTAADAAVSAAEGAAVADALVQDLLGHTTEHLNALAQTGDAHIQEMVGYAIQNLPGIGTAMQQSAATAVGAGNTMAAGVNAAINAIPKEPHVHMVVDADTTNVDVLRAQLEGITRSDWRVRVAVDVGALPPGIYPA